MAFSKGFYSSMTAVPLSLERADIIAFGHAMVAGVAAAAAFL